MSNPVIGFSIGDINGIGLEVTLKALNEPMILSKIIPIIFASDKVVAFHKNILTRGELVLHSLNPGEKPHEGMINVMNVWPETVTITLGEMSETGGKYATLSLQSAVDALKSKEIDALVTAPINKKAMEMAGFEHPGHTEFLTTAFGKNSLMILATDSLRVGIVTGHIPISEVAGKISTDLIIRKAQIFLDSLKIDFGIEKPRLAVLGLNPHAGDNGLFGQEEKDIIIPAIMSLKSKGHIIQGPFPADGFFGAGTWKHFDGVLAMYHDQGLIPFKTLAFGSGVNFTAGLPVIRTSPDHGTGFDIAGKGVAKADSLRSSIYLALDIYRQREEYHYYQKNKLRKNVRTEEPNVSDD